MAKYLVVTHQTALSPELRQRVSALMAEDAAAEFSVLVPEAPATSTWEGETLDGARQRAEAAKTLLEETVGANVVRTIVGVPEPLQAIAEELRRHPGYDTLVICTLPPGLSRWLRLDLLHQAKRKFGLQVVHVVAEAVSTARR
jgi:predicted RNase H-like HicB family nuclease